jgi:FkbM family methyltransferase
MNRIPRAAQLLRWYSLHSPLRRGSYRLALWLYQHSTIPDIEVDATIDRTLWVSLRLRSWVDWNIYCLGIYEAPLAQCFVSLLQPESVVLDVGAYIGQYTLLAAKYAPQGRVVAIEAHPVSFQRLEHNARRNKLPNVEQLNLAAGAAIGHMAFALSADSFTSSLVPDDTVSLTPTIQVDVAPLDEIVYRLSLPGVDLVKIDVEGAEGAVLTGARALLRKYRPALIIEVDREREAVFENSPEQIAASLRDLGYRICRLGRTGLRDLGDTVPDYENLIAIPTT